MRDDFGEQDRMEFVTDRETRQEDKGGEEIRSENVFEEAKNITAQKPGEDGKGIRKLWNWGKRHPFLSLLFLSMAVPMVVLLLVVLIKYGALLLLGGGGRGGLRLRLGLDRLGVRHLPEHPHLGGVGLEIGRAHV